MAIKPEELVLSATDIAEADIIEAKIDETIRNRWMPGERVFTVNFVRNSSERARVEVVRRYKEVGWAKVYWKGLYDIVLEK